MWSICASRRPATARSSPSPRVDILFIDAAFLQADAVVAAKRGHLIAH
jgi:hypothetical protein